MARVVNQLIEVSLSGGATVKQYSGAGPLVVKLPGVRGEVHASSGDYLLYEGLEVVGVVGGSFFDALRADKDSLETPELPTGVDITAVVLDKKNGNPLPKESVFLKQDGAPIATGMTDDTGSVSFNVLPGSYTVGPQDASHGPDVEVVAEAPTLESVAAKSSPAPASTPSTPARFDVMGNPDPNGLYDETGAKLV